MICQNCRKDIVLLLVEKTVIPIEDGDIPFKTEPDPATPCSRNFKLVCGCSNLELSPDDKKLILNKNQSGYNIFINEHAKLVR